MLGLGDSEGAKGVGLEGLTGELGKAKAPEWKSSFDSRTSSHEFASGLTISRLRVRFLSVGETRALG